MTAKRYFVRGRVQGVGYRWFVEREHINRPREILEELGAYFTVVRRSFFPIPIPLIFCNLVIGLTLQPKEAQS